jgi:hypothetical protein
MASSLPLAAAMGKEHGCTTATGIAGVWPNTAVEGGTTVLSGGGGIHHTVLQKSTARPTTARGNRHHHLPLPLISISNDLHQPLLINGSTHQVIVGQVGEQD